MMTPEELAEELKNLHYTEKLVLAQRLIEYAYDELGQLSSQLAPKRDSCTINGTYKEIAQEPEPDEIELPLENQENAPQKAEKKTQRNAKACKSRKNIKKEIKTSTEEILSFNDLVSRLQSLQCSKESTLISAIKELYKYRGEISQCDAKKIVARLKQKKIITIDSNSRIIWK